MKNKLKLGLAGIVAATALVFGSISLVHAFKGNSKSLTSVVQTVKSEDNSIPVQRYPNSNVYTLPSGKVYEIYSEIRDICINLGKIDSREHKVLIVENVPEGNKEPFLNQKNDAPPHLERCGLNGTRFFDARESPHSKGRGFQDSQHNERKEFNLPAGEYDVWRNENGSWIKMGEINPPKDLRLVERQKKSNLDEICIPGTNKVSEGYARKHSIPEGYIVKPHPYKEGEWLFVKDLDNAEPGEWRASSDAQSECQEHTEGFYTVKPGPFGKPVLIVEPDLKKPGPIYHSTTPIFSRENPDGSTDYFLNNQHLYHLDPVKKN